MAMMLARRSPMLLLSLVAIVISIMRWKRHPRVSLMTAIGFIIYIIDAFLISILLYVFPTMITAMRTTPKVIEWLYFFLFFFVDFISVAMILLLVGAAFSQRKTTPAELDA
jgi:hypothetical protein